MSDVIQWENTVTKKIHRMAHVLHWQKIHCMWLTIYFYKTLYTSQFILHKYHPISCNFVLKKITLKFTHCFEETTLYNSQYAFCVGCKMKILKMVIFFTLKKFSFSYLWLNCIANHFKNVGEESSG